MKKVEIMSLFVSLIFGGIYYFYKIPALLTISILFLIAYASISVVRKYRMKNSQVLGHPDARDEFGRKMDYDGSHGNKDLGKK